MAKRNGNKAPRSSNIGADGKRLNKTAWIRARPKSESASDVVAAAKAEGIKLSPAQVYTARSTANKLASGKGDTVIKSISAIVSKRGREPVHQSEVSDLQAQFTALVLRAGTENAKSWLAQAAQA